MATNKKSNSANGMTVKQKQAAIVSVLCALALIVTICVTAVNVSKVDKKGESSSSSKVENTGYTGENYVIDTATNTAVLGEGTDAGEEYLEETLFIGDSNTLRFYNNGLLTPQQFCAVESLGIQQATSQKFVTFKSDSTLYTIPEAIAKIKPRRVVITLGTNNADGSMSTSNFVDEYKKLLAAIQQSYSYADIIINAIPPVPVEHSTYPDIDQEVIDEFNMALADLAKDSGYKFLNSAEALKDKTGYGDEDYYAVDDIHLKKAGLDKMLDYVKTHPYIADDRRPDTDNIATRTQSNTSSNGFATPSPTNKPDSFTAKYFVDSAGGGTLTSGDETGKQNFSFDIDSNDETGVTVTAVPNDGSVFIKWSDEIKTATRTDKELTQNVNVTAIFAPIGFSIKLNTAESDLKIGATLEFQATVTGGYAQVGNVKWYVNDVQNALTGEKLWIALENKEYKVYAKVDYNGVTVTSNTIAIDDIEFIKVPDLSGKTEADAKTALTSIGLAVGTVTYKETTTDSEVGKVLSQATAKDTDVVKGTAINFVVGKQKVASTVEVPGVIGMKEDVAVTTLSNKGFKNIVKVSEYSEDVATGLVFKQNPTAGEQKTTDTQITITISKGKAPVTTGTIPNFASTDTYDTVKAALNAMGFTNVAKAEEYNDAVAGSFLSVNPASGTANVAFATAITVTVSKGPKPPETVAVPSIIGSAQADATTAITNVGLVLGSVTEQVDDANVGKVISCDPGVGTTVNKNSTVNIVVGVASPAPDTTTDG